MADILNTEENYNPKLGLKNIYAKLLEIIAKVNTLWANSPNVKVYKALLTQTGTDAPVATVLANTLSGLPVWSRSGIGQYRLTLTDEFPQAKTFCLVNQDANGTYLIYTVNSNTMQLESAGGDDCLSYTTVYIEVYP